jgi:hypothetical protein
VPEESPIDRAEYDRRIYLAQAIRSPSKIWKGTSVTSAEPTGIHPVL